MSQPEKQALETNFEKWRRARVPDWERGSAFERYCIEQILKHYQLSDEEIAYGHCGDSDDGGADAFYLFMDKHLITERAAVPDSVNAVNLFVIQATTKDGGFSEKRMEKFNSFAQDVFDYRTLPDQLTHLDAGVRALIKNFREKYGAVSAQNHHFNVTFCYAGNIDKSAQSNRKLEPRFNKIKRTVTNAFSHANVTWEPWGTRALLDRNREEPETIRPLAVADGKVFLTKNGGAICMTRLGDFYTFLKGVDGSIDTSILEPNVRDYQGPKNLVNTAIQKTLRDEKEIDFWWLNNGVTVLAEDCQNRGDVLSLVKPEIVNGLQTSHEIFNYFKDGGGSLSDTRCLIVRVIKPPTPKIESKITRATNYQTAVANLVLHSTEIIHLDIEDLFGLHGFAYDRKKGKCKRLGIPVWKIVSPLELSRAVIAILVGKPDTARARPQTLLDTEEGYREVFNEHYNRDMYLAAITLDRRISSGLRPALGCTSAEARDIKYYVDRLIVCGLTSEAPTDADIASVLPSIKSLPSETVAEAGREVLNNYRSLGGTERTAKGPELNEWLQGRVREHRRKVR